MNDKLQLIREKCIAANPENISKGDNGRTLRLADVLLAIRAKLGNPDGENYVELAHAEATITEQYNLRADDLEKQSSETIDFLFQLLQ